MPANFNNAPFLGVSSPSWMVGSQRGPHWCVDGSASFTTTATRLYYYPMYFDRAEILAGARTFNFGAGDTGETYRVGLYFDNGSNGGPGTLAKDFGEVTLTAASALRTLANSYSMVSPGWYWIAVHHNAATAMYSFTAMLQVTAAGYILPNAARLIGSVTSTSEFGSPASTQPFWYVDTSYGALASTAVTPTASTDFAPAVRFYK